MKRKSLIYRLYKISRAIYLKKIPFIPSIIQLMIRVLFGCTIPATAEIGGGTIFPHAGSGVVIHRNSIIGENCTILQNVTIGGKKGSERVPIIGNNVMIGAGAVVLGEVKIGDNVNIGANSVVTKDIPSNSVVVGVPGRVIKSLEVGKGEK